MLLYNFVFWSTLILAVNGRPNAGMFEMRISGGEQSSIESHPYMVAMYRGNFGNTCGGSIIARNLILTASHCIPDDFAKVTIRSGSTYQKVNGTLHRIVSYIRHENYDVDFSKNGKVTVNDIAIAKVEPPFEFDDTRQPISLFNADESIKPGSSGVISGWGYVPFIQRIPWSTLDVVLKRLISAKVPIYEKSACATEHMRHRNYTIKSGQICAGRNQGSCRGDSGGPLIVDGRQAAIVSWGYSCDHEGYPPTVYTEISHFRNWIDEQALKLAGVRLEKVVVTEQPIATNTIKLEFHHGQNYFHDRPVWF